MPSDTLRKKIEQHQRERLRLNAARCFSKVASKLKLSESDFQVLTSCDRSFSDRIATIQHDYSFAWPLGTSNTFQRSGTYSDIEDLSTLVNTAIAELGVRENAPEPVLLYCETQSHAIEVPAQAFFGNTRTVLDYLWQLSSKGYNSCIYILPESTQWMFLAGTEPAATFDFVVRPENGDGK